MDQPTAVLAPVVLEPAAPEAPRARPRWPGILSFGFALVTLAGLVTGLVLVTTDSFAAATWAAWIATGVSAAAVVLAIVALIGNLGRGWAVAALIVGVVANPPLLTRALDAIGGLWA